jgi:hypothetical protein
VSTHRTQATPQSSLPFGEEAKPGFRTKTAATRLTPEELGEIEAPLAQKLFAFDAVALGSCDVPFATRCAECVA